MVLVIITFQAGGDLVSTGIVILKLHAEGSIDLVNPDGNS